MRVAPMAVGYLSPGTSADPSGQNLACDVIDSV